MRKAELAAVAAAAVVLRSTDYIRMVSVWSFGLASLGRLRAGNIGACILVPAAGAVEWSEDDARD